MARATDDVSFLKELTSGALYKRNQGRLARQLTALAVIGIALFGAWTLSHTVLADSGRPVSLGIPLAVSALAIWFAYRLVNYPRFADFLISVEAEMDKVSWPDRTYLIRATGVVLVVMVLMGVYLSVWDIAWMQIFNFVGFLDIDALRGE
ncbi:MAG: preprotein translocase subunit SecE [Planctomycetaceae bacterium]